MGSTINNDVEAFVKFNYFHKEQSKKWIPARQKVLSSPEL